MIQEIEDFETIEMGKSDHLPIKIKLKNMGRTTNEEEEEEPGPNTINKLIWDNNKCEDYQKTIEEQLAEIEETEENPHLKIITVIKNVANALGMSTVKKINRSKNTIKRPWYNLECSRARKELKETAKAFIKNAGAQEREEYLETRKYYRTIISRTKKEYYRNIRTEITNVKDSATFWKLVKKLNCRTIPECKIDVKEWQIYFQDMYKENTGLILHLMDARHPYLDQDIQLIELNAILNKLKPKKAPGPDGVTNEFLKYSPHNMRGQLLYLMNRTLHTGEIPQCWTSANTIMLHKKGSKLDPNNYRGITLANTIVKIFTTILARRLNTWC